MKKVLSRIAAPYNYRLPTEAEWQAEIDSWSSLDAAGAFGSVLKLNQNGVRDNVDGTIGAFGNLGTCWSSTVIGFKSRFVIFDFGNALIVDYNRAMGASIRLIKDGTFTSNPNETITINGLTYQSVFNPTTGRVWLDRNIGATQVASSSTDSAAYGDLFQWGRSADGHEKRDSLLHDGDANGKPSTPNESGTWDGKFITTSVSPNDWLDPQDDNLWQGVNGVNNPGLDAERKRIYLTRGNKALARKV